MFMALGLGHASASEVRRIEKAVCSLVQSFDCRSFDRFSEKRYWAFLQEKPGVRPKPFAERAVFADSIRPR